ncbi:MAG: hypothetical protein WCD70_14945 [Alphaproteobacteria bacterium]
MGWQETAIANEIMIASSKVGVVLHKNIRGMFYTLDKKHKVKAGLLADGSGDLIGYTPTIITQEMVGQTIAIYTSVEVKTETGTAKKHQKDWRDRVLSRGGKAGIARSVEDALEILK